MSALRTKLIRDLTRMGGQVITISLVVACGIASLVSMISTYDSLRYSKDVFYAHYRMADVFAHLNRAPEAVADRMRAIPGVARVETRIVKDVLVDLDDMPEPAVGRIVTVSRDERAGLNALYLRSGRLPERGRRNEVVVSEAFAKANTLVTGSSLVAVLNGRRERLRIVGVALSPEHVFAVPPGALFNDDRRFGILWMDRDSVAPALRMEGTFNDVVLGLERGAPVTAITDDLERILEPWGCLGVQPRAEQGSDRFITQELGQLRGMATVVPFIFLGVAAFLLNVVLSRIIGTQREQIAALKALGYSNGAVGRHYLGLVFVIVILGSALGIAFGAWGGRAFTDLYADYFRFPVLAYRIEPSLVVTGVGVSLLSGIVGALGAVRRAVRLPPAQAMRPEAPEAYHRTLVDRLGLHAIFRHSTRMVLRDLERRPGRLLLSSLAIAFSVAILITGRFSVDALELMIDVQFERAQREDFTVGFVGPQPERAVRELARLPGVLRAEPMRAVPVRIHAGHRSRETAIVGFDPTSTLRAIVDMQERQIELPARGVLLSRVLAERLHVRPGDSVDVEVLEGERVRRPLLVAATVDDMFGLTAQMRLDELARWLGENRTASAAMLAIDPLARDGLEQRLQRLPSVASVSRTDILVEYFRAQSGRTIVVETLILALFGAIIAIGVVYNNARIALALRARDLASLRVLGFTRGEISSILLGEQAAQLVLGIPVGLVLGRALAAWVMTTVDPELFRMPTIVSGQTYSFAIGVVLIASLLSALVVRRKIDTLDLVSVLKTRE